MEHTIHTLIIQQEDVQGNVHLFLTIMQMIRHGHVFHFVLIRQFLVHLLIILIEDANLFATGLLITILIIQQEIA